MWFSLFTEAQSIAQQPDVISIGILIFFGLSQVNIKDIQFIAHSNISQKLKPLSMFPPNILIAGKLTNSSILPGVPSS